MTSLTERIEAGDIEGLLKGYGHRVRCRRKSLELTLDQVAERSGLAKSYVWEIENGKNKNPTLRTTFALCRALGWSFAELIGLADDSLSLHPTAVKIAIEVDAALRARGVM